MGAPTLIVGLGGKGIQIIELIAHRAAEEGLTDVEFVVMDTDVNDLRRVQRDHPNIHTIQTSPKGTVGAALDTNPEAKDNWFPLNAGLMGKPFTEGAGQVRAVSRLAFDHAVEEGHMRELEVAIENLRGLSGKTLRQEMRVMITGSIAGGTGSGIILPVAMFIRNYLITRYQDDSAIIRGYFLEPDTLFDVIKDEEERNSLRCNAYATIRELDAFFRKEYSGESREFSHVVFNAPQPGMTERLDYPNILPFHYVFLMDAINAQGERLPNSQAYVDHIADVIFAQTLSQASSKSNSAEDNVIRKLSASGGRARYCGAGCSYLEYPVKAVQRYIGLTWAANSISQEWMEIDRDFMRLDRERKAPDRDVHYRDFFENNRATRGFYSKAAKGTTHMMSTEDRNAGPIEEPVAEMYVERLLSHAETWNESGLSAACDELRSFEDNAEGFDHVPESQQEVHDFATRHQGARGNLTAQYDGLHKYHTRHFSIISDSVRRAARRYAQMDFSVSEFNVNPLTSRTEDWHLEKYVYNEGETIHPSGVRFLLSSIIIRLKEELETLRQECDGKQRFISETLSGDFYDATESKEDVQQAVSAIFSQEGGSKNPITALMGKGGDFTPEQESRLGEIGEILNSLSSEIEEFRELVVKTEIVSAALSYATKLNRAYIAFYNYLSDQIDSLDAEVESIRYDGDFNACRGVTRRYVCANTRCLERMERQCAQRGDAGDIPADLCADIYRGLLRYTTLLDVVAEARDMTVAEKNRAFGDLYERTVKDFWVKRVLDPSDGYPSVVDKNIVQAILDEARYLYPEETSDPARGDGFLENYLEKTFDQARHIATPFIEPPVGEQPRHIELCAYSADALERVGTIKPKLDKILSVCNGNKLASGSFSKYLIMFYSSLYGFCATNLPKYAPAHSGMQRRPEGEYHRVYWNMVKQLSPDLASNKLVTPHIDKNWHLISYLPDLNDDYERQLKNEIMRAYIFGLTSQQFGKEDIKRGHLFYLTTRRGSSRVDLMVSNGTHCDRFYEVFDALKFSPTVVYELLSRSDQSFAKERDNAVTLMVETSNFIRNTRSQAFGEHITRDVVLKRIAEYATSDTALLGDLKYKKQDADDFLARMVTNMFKGKDPSGRIYRRSIFEIPVFYKISLPHSDERVGEIESMLDGILASAHDYFENFCDPNDLDDVCEQFFEEQLLRFEYNLVELDAHFPGCGSDRTANTVREKVASFFDQSSEIGERVWGISDEIGDAWDKVLARRRELERNRAIAVADGE